jgi:hypothetical protein
MAAKKKTKKPVKPVKKPAKRPAKKTSTKVAQKPVRSPAQRASGALAETEEREALDKVTKEISILAANVAESFHAIGKKLIAIDELRLYEAKGYVSLDDYVDKELQISRSAAFQYTRVAGVFTADACEHYGVVKLDWAITHVLHTPEDDVPADVLDREFEVSTEDGGTTKKRFEDLTRADMKEIGARTRGDSDAAREKKKAAELPTAVRKLFVALNGKLDRVAGRQANAEWRETTDETLVTLEGIPLQHLRATLEALLEVIP